MMIDPVFPFYKAETHLLDASLQFYAAGYLMLVTGYWNVNA
jgi:hypothetical protein